MPQSYGHVQPLVGVGRPRVGAARCPRTRCARRRARRGPEAERAVDVHPGAMRVGDSRRPSRRSSNAPVFTSPACAQTIVGVRRSAARPRASSDAHPSLVVGGYDELLRAADPEQAQRPVEGDVALLADDDPERRRAGEAVLAEVPADPCVARRDAPRRAQVTCAIWQPVTNANDECERQAEQLEHPAARDRLERRGGRRRLRPARCSGPTRRRASRRRAMPAARRR